MTKKIATIYYAGFLRFGGVISHVRSIEIELTRIGWIVNVITLDKLPIWCRFLPHLTEKIINSCFDNNKTFKCPEYIDITSFIDKAPYPNPDNSGHQYL